MAYQSIDRSVWSTFSDRISSVLRGREVELEVIGLELGDQISAPLIIDGVSYDSPGDALHVFMQAGTGREHVDHVIYSPQEIYIELSDAGVSQLAVMDGGGHKQFLWVRRLPQLPSSPWPET